MSYFNDRITITLTAVEMATIREALRYGARQVHASDIPVFKSFETLDENTGEVIFDEDMHHNNQAKADLALELADTLDLIEADGTDWEVLNSPSGGQVKAYISVWCRHHKTDDFGTPLVREFIWGYTPKQTFMPNTVFTSIFEDCVMPLNTQIAVHWVPFHHIPHNKLHDKDEVTYYDLDALQNRTMIITGDEAIDNDIMDALWTFINYRG